MSYETKTFTRKYPSQQIGEPLHFVAKRYVPADSSPTGLTLLFFHCTGSHKEVWEPVIQGLFDGHLQTGIAIREAWTWDWQTHGEAGRLNAAVIAHTKEHIVASELVYGVKRFAATEGVFKGHTLAGIGHSSGATSLMLTTVDDAQPGLRYKAIIIMEPSTLTRESSTQGDIHAEMRVLRGIIEKRRNTWKSREEARQYFQARLPWKKWDPRSFELFLDNGLMEQTIQQPDGSTTTNVTLCCSPFQEGAAYYGHGEIHYAAAERLGTLDPNIPVHIVFVTPAETMPETQRNSVLQLRKFASITLLPNVGHLLVQEKPDMVVTLIYDKLKSISAPQAKL